MIFNGDANGQDLVTLANRLAKTNNNRYTLSEKAQDATWGLRTIWGLIYQVYGGWIFDDNNQGTLPEYTRDLTQNQVFYELPPETNALFEVSFMDSNNSYKKLLPITIEEINDSGYAEDYFQITPGYPRWYRPVANGFKVYPAWQPASVPNGLKIKISRDVVAFTPISANVAPGFDSIFHEAIASFMALKYSTINSLPVAGGTLRGGYKTGLLADWADWEQRIQDYYKAKYRQMFPQTIKHRQNLVAQYE